MAPGISGAGGPPVTAAVACRKRSKRSFSRRRAPGLGAGPGRFTPVGAGEGDSIIIVSGAGGLAATAAVSCRNLSNGTPRPGNAVALACIPE